MYTSYREEKSNQKEFVLISKSLHFHKKLASNIAKHFGRFVAAWLSSATEKKMT